MTEQEKINDKLMEEIADIDYMLSRQMDRASMLCDYLHEDDRKEFYEFKERYGKIHLNYILSRNNDYEVYILIFKSLQNEFRYIFNDIKTKYRKVYYKDR